MAEVVTPAKAGQPPLLVAFIRGIDFKDSESEETQKNDRGGTERKQKELLAAPTDIFHTAIPAAKAVLYNTVLVYIVPAAFLPLQAVLLTVTGKTNHRQLQDYRAALSQAEIKAYHSTVTAKHHPATLAERTI